MSHYPLVVIIQPEEGSDDAAVEAAVDRLMRPFDWNTEVEAYEEDCGDCEGLETPDPECEECHGTGRWISTANPQGKWDWWQRGGRFTGGLVTDYVPEADPANRETCPFCSALDSIREQEECLTCGSTGTALKWPTQWRLFERDVLPVPVVRTDWVPFGVLTPEGTWIDEGNFPGRRAAWEREYRAVMATHQGYLAVIIDFHL